MRQTLEEQANELSAIDINMIIQGDEPLSLEEHSKLSELLEDNKNARWFAGIILMTKGVHFAKRVRLFIKTGK